MQETSLSDLRHIIPIIVWFPSPKRHRHFILISNNTIIFQIIKGAYFSNVRIFVRFPTYLTFINHDNWLKNYIITNGKKIALSIYLHGVETTQYNK
jgi:hypothetical protein